MTADVAVDVAVDRPVPELKLSCALVRPIDRQPSDAFTVAPDVAPAVACRWSEVDADDLRGYQLWRIVDAPDGEARRLIATVPAGEPRRYIDTEVSPGHRYTYREHLHGRRGRPRDAPPD